MTLYRNLTDRQKKMILEATLGDCIIAERLGTTRGNVAKIRQRLKEAQEGALKSYHRYSPRVRVENRS